tara:strand:- start:632 stop:1084 length:453 start_codon:yes stop_codon:yes gene_type:complete
MKQVYIESTINLNRTVNMSDWDKFEQQAKHKPLTEMIEGLLDARRKQDEANKLVEQFEAKLIAEFPEEFGEQSKAIGDNIVTVNRQERFHWDQDKLEEIFNKSPLPPHVKRRLTVEKRTYQKLTKAEQDTVEPALTIKPGPVSVKITRSS